MSSSSPATWLLAQDASSLCIRFCSYISGLVTLVALQVLFIHELMQGMLVVRVVEAAQICSMCKGGFHGCSNSCGFDSCWHGEWKCSGGRDEGAQGLREEDDDDMALLHWMNFQLLDHDTCHSLIGQFNKWRIVTWHDLSASQFMSGKRGENRQRQGCRSRFSIGHLEQGSV